MENREHDDPSQLRELDCRRKINPRNLSLRNKKLSIKKQDDERLAQESDRSAGHSKAIETFLHSENSISTSSCGMFSDITSLDKDDSLADFRSPVKETDLNESLADFKVSLRNKRLTHKENKPVLKKKQKKNRDALSNVNQPSIESSFFKPQTMVKTGFPCPLCFKSFKDTTTKNSHMKSCATKNKVSTKTLLDAVELQAKQANERKALGLLEAPPIQPKKTVSRKLISDKDPQLQIALALSMSLHEAQLMEEIEDAHLLVGEPCPSSYGEMTEERRKTLQNFGFTTNKPATVSTSNKSKKRRLAGPTLLQTRTKQERDHILSVQIAEVLMGDKAITQAMVEEEGEVTKPEENIILKSRLLQSYERVTDRLWDKTQQCLGSKGSYFCNQLELLLCKVTVESETKSGQEEPPKEEPLDQSAKYLPGTIDENITALSESSISSEAESLTADDNPVTTLKSRIDGEFIGHLSNDWRFLLINSYMSDVSVIVKGDTKLPAHRLVLFVRCREVLDDAIPNDHIMARIYWPEIEVSVASAFLEYIYCSVIVEYVSVFDDPNTLSEVRALARKYKLKQIFVYLRDKSKELKSNKVNMLTQQPHLKMNSEPDLTDMPDSNSSCSGKEEVSISSNPPDSVWNNLEKNKQDIEYHKSDCNNVQDAHLELKIQQKREMFSHVSFNKDSFGAQFLSTSANTRTACENLSTIPTSQKNSKSIETVNFNTTNEKSFERITSAFSKTNCDVLPWTESLKLLDKNFEVDRSISPDIFDDSVIENPSHTIMALEQQGCNLEHTTNGSDSDIEVISPSTKTLETKNSNYDILTANKTADLTHRRKCGKPEVNFEFVSTRKRKSYRHPLSINDADPYVEVDDMNFDKNKSNMFIKKKGDITIAIERIQKVNSKGISESDSECESVAMYPSKKRKNPFRIKRSDVSPKIEKNLQDTTRLDLDYKVPSKKRTALSIFEAKIESEAIKNPAIFNLPTHKIISDVCLKNMGSSHISKPEVSCDELTDSKVHEEEDNDEDTENEIEPSQKRVAKLDDTVNAIFDLTQESSRESKLNSDEETNNTDTEDKDLSMFTKYKRKHSHNSIDKYRCALKNNNSRISISSSKVTNERLSSEDYQSSGDELWNTHDAANCNSYSSKYEYTDPNQSTSNIQRELSGRLPMGRKNVEKSPEILSSTDSDTGEQNVLKFDDAEPSDLEIDLSDLSSTKSLNISTKSRKNGKYYRMSLSKIKSNNEMSDDERMDKNTVKEIQSFIDLKLEDTILENDDGKTKKSNISDEDTDAECWIESVLPRQAEKVESSELGKPKKSDIYSEETDPGDMEEKNDDEIEKIPDLQHLDENSFDISSPDCEISGIISSASMDLNLVNIVSNNVDSLLEKCSRSNHTSPKSPVNLATPSRADPSDSFISTPISRTYRTVFDDVFSHDRISDADFNEAEFSVKQNSSKINAVNTKKRGDASNQSTVKKYHILDSDLSDNENSNIHKMSKTPSNFSMKRSKVRTSKHSTSHSRSGSISPINIPKRSLVSLQKRSISENIIKTKESNSSNLMSDSFDCELAKVRTPPVQHQDISKGENETTPVQEVPTENVTPLANYSAMKTPELRKELNKYGLKAQKRHRAKQLLRYIYNELHPLVPVADDNVTSYSNLYSSNNECPAPKRLNRSNSIEDLNGKNTANVESDSEALVFDARTVGEASDDYEGADYNDSYTLSQSDNSDSLESFFRKLIQVDKVLHNKILAYEPLILEDLHATLKAQGLKCNLNALMDLLDEQCITFRTLANSKKSRTKRKISPKKN
ncbi:uncharacterized protein LOC124178782 isoform X1 [Neodiprion fabricii]|uniref:uncharacterized protein LOC124178782 isoform X1 n=1 Tax=Neodiprion fabricii TaxID=2872261 RepID=UPI001ED8F03B|nr:uncharacterized protein LOC124178782 isoform X1 [Neodiprion fabricii]XP_046418370.1 uncharacterized protein LOC124178782 isoform X1 [Neodiprion fabricii]XP_046418371.1 uncharacterized protein LOC124178782 isoform X1 [Neodiprion fabricii]